VGFDGLKPASKTLTWETANVARGHFRTGHRQLQRPLYPTGIGSQTGHVRKVRILLKSRKLKSSENLAKVE
jgi:hypothetical protein